MKRLDKLLSDAGVAGRRELKDIIRAGRVSVNGVVVTKADTKVDEQTVTVTVDGTPVATDKYVYIMLHKPAGVVTATEDRSQKTVVDLLPEQYRRREVFPVGRLDKDTTGLLILTDDGEYGHQIISPRSEVLKRYRAETDGIVNEEDVKAFENGIELRDGTKCLPAKLEITGTGTCYVTIMEGKYHQVKRMLASRGKPVTSLHRCSIGGLLLDETLLPGEFRPLTVDEREKALLKLPL